MIQHQDKVDAARMAVGAGGAVIYGLTLNQWVAIATLIYLTLQIGLLVPRYWTMWQKYKKKRNDKNNKIL